MEPILWATLTGFAVFLVTMLFLVRQIITIRRESNLPLLYDRASNLEFQRMLEERGFGALQKDLRERLDRNPADYVALESLTFMYLRLGGTRGWDAAFRLMNERKADFSNDSRYHALLAQVYSQMPDRTLGRRLTLSSMARSLELDPRNPYNYRMLGYFYWLYGDIYQAIDETKKAVDLANNNPGEAALAKGNLAYYWGTNRTNGEQALRYAKEAMSVRRAPAEMDTLAFVLIQFAEGSEAGSQLDEAHRLLIEARGMPGAAKDLIDEHLALLTKRQKELIVPARQ